MNKKQTIKSITLSTVLITALAGCGGGGGGSGSSSNDTSSKQSASGIEYDSCVDLNKNLICEESEKNLNPSDYPDIPVTVKENNGKYLSGPAGASKVSAESTLVYNEMTYNPSVDNNQNQAESYIRSKIGNSEGGSSASKSAVNTNSSSSSLLSEAQSLELEESIKKAVEANPNANRNSVIAAVSEKFLANQSLDITPSDIENQVRILTEVKTELYNKVDWQNETTSDLVGKIEDQVDADLVKEQGGEKIIYLHGNGNYQIAASQYHNALTVINYNESKEHKYEKFAAFRVNYSTGTGGTLSAPTSNDGGSAGGGSSGGGSGSSGGSAGGASLNSLPKYSVTNYNLTSNSDYTINDDPRNTKGLWEHLLEQAKITKDGKYVYALIRSKDESITFPDESTYGFYRTSVGKYGVHPYNHESTIKISSKDIKKFELSNSDNRVVVYGQVVNDKDEKQNILRVLDENLKLIKAIEIDNINDFTITANDKYIVASIKSDYLNKAKLVKFDSESLGNKKQLELNFDVDEVYTYAHGTMALVVSNESNKIAVVNLESMSIEKEKTIDIDIKLSSISTDGKFLALGAKEKVNIYNLSTPELTFQTSIAPLADSPEEVPLESPFYDSGAEEKEDNYIDNLSFVGNSLLSLTLKNQQNQVLTYNVIDTKRAMDIDMKLDSALLTLDKHSINNGHDFTNVKDDLVLAKSYDDVKFTWYSSELKTNINLDTGKVTRDDSTDLHGKLFVRASTTFRDETKFKEKSFNLTIKKDSPKVGDSVSKFNQLHTLNTMGNMKKIISNSDASILVSFSQSDDFNKGYNLFKLNSDELKFTLGDENTFENSREEIVNMTFKSDEKLIVVTVNPNTPGFSSLYLQDVDTNSLGTKHSNLSIGNYGNPRSAGFSGDKNKVVVIRKDHDFNHGDYYADFYKISGNTITKEKSTRMKAGIEYINTYAPAVNEDGSVFYQIAENTIYKHIDSYTNSSVRLDKVNAVYYFNDRIYATTSDGLIVSYDKDLSEGSKQEFNLATKAKIVNLEYKNNTLFAFSEGSKAGVYMISVNASNEMSALKYSLKENTKGGTISGNSEHIFTFDNKPTTYQSNVKSTLSYSKSN